MRILYVIIMLFSFSGLISQEDINKTDSKGLKQGKWVKYHEGTTNVKYIGEFKNDNPAGTFKFYYPNGNLKGISEYSNEGKDSYAAMYHENQKLMSYGKYTNQKKDSTWIYYDENENLTLVENYSDGKLNGKRTVYYPKKEGDKYLSVLEITNYKDDLRHGEWAQYYKNGEKLSEGTYELDDFVGKVIYYHSNGEKNHVHNYKNGVKHGFCLSYDQSGEEIGKVYYWKGKLLEGEVLEKHLEFIKTKKAAQIEKNKAEKSSQEEEEEE